MWTLDDIIPTSIPLAARLGILRGIRALLGYVLGGIVAALGDGSLIGLLPIIPAGYAPFVAAAIGILLQAIDKWLRTRKLLEEAEEEDAGKPMSSEEINALNNPLMLDNPPLRDEVIEKKD